MKIVKTQTLPEVGVSHNADIKKKVFINSGDIPKIMMFGSVIFTPGQFVEIHKHETMFEVFYIQKGKAEFIINNKKIIATPGDCITIEPGELHSQCNPYQENVEWLYFGVATD